MTFAQRGRLSGPILLLAIAALPAAPCAAASSISRSVFGSGGGAQSSAQHAVRSSIGQATSQSASSATLAMYSGFFSPGAQSPTAVPDSEILPLVYRYHGNFPNPFNPRTTVAFDLPAPASRLTLRLFDIAGRHVATLVDGALPAGRHRVVWNGTDRNGVSVASGVYVCQLQSEQLNATSKLTLVR